MKKGLSFIFIMLFIVSLVIGCSQKTNLGMPTVNDMKYEDFQSFKGTFLGDNSKVSAILTALPGGPTFKSMEIN